MERRAAAPIFIVGPPRSGTTLVRDVLNEHPNVHIGRETHYFDDLRPRLHRLAPGESAELAAAYFGELVDRYYGREAAGAVRDVDPAVVERTASALGGDPDAWFMAFCMAQADDPRCTRWGEKTPRHVFRILEMASVFPGAAFVALVRDPRAVVASYADWTSNGHWEAAERERIAASADPAVVALLWRSAVRSAERALKVLGPARVKLVRFESLIMRPEAVLDGLWSWLGEEPAEHVIHPRMTNSSYVPEGAVSGFRREALERWRGRLDEHDKWVVETLAGRRLLQRYGYDRSTSRWDLAGTARLGGTPRAVVRALRASRPRTESLPRYVALRLRGLGTR